MAKPTNILFIFSDQHNPKFTGYEGHAFCRTPHLDALAQGGVRFANCYSPNPICVPCRFSMLSGLYTRDICVYTNSDVPSADLPSFARHFAQHGWRTGLIGKGHFTGEDQFRGYQERPYGDFLGIGHQTDPFRGANPELEGPGGCGNHPIGGSFKMAGPSGIPEFQHSEHIITSEAVKWLQIHRATQRERPFLLSVHYPRPHFPYMPPPRWFETYRECTRGRVHAPTASDMEDRLPIHQASWKVYLSYGPSQSEIDNALAGYTGNVSYMDESIGYLLQSLKHLGYLDDTLIIYSSDHGEMAGAHGLWHKQLFYEESARVPLIFSGPGVAQGQIRPNLASLVDMFPTLCDMADLPIPQHCVGTSLAPLLTAPGDVGERSIYSEIAWRPDQRGCMVRQGPWKYCWYLDGSDELYNLETDPDEERNLAEDPSVADVRQTLNERLLAFWQPEDLQRRLNALAKVPGKGNVHGVAYQYCLPDGSWVDAWP
jgi:choline-sulfatase